MRVMPGPNIILLYDNHCKWCTVLAQTASWLSRAYIRIIGHYSATGRAVKKAFFSPDDNPEEMFWLIRNDTCYGGRKGLLPLATEILRGMLR